MQQKEIKVRADLLSNYLTKFDKIDLLKMDIEGAEVEVTEELFRSNAISKIDQLLVEYHHNIEPSSSTLSVFLKQFEEKGYGFNLRAKYSSVKGIQNIYLFIFIKNIAYSFKIYSLLML